ncbi:DNA repair protein RecO [Candidatus Curtissbacteria bacterium RIFCSPHIGHO2_01_FULL_41_44]|uniref:DNA repair protein RecO n=1 Tax=Candidatus Curtissbacteria bacterium RIFCSPLOWO2_01_FULL_42_50 TaxID=1797730 RepID=A0A1F5H355_9BACT|nr:MAG: DNA repair protein RecO [Candidatus Curtissbacteria bacterium RIFCSPHIGHO2_02_FULL_42_58]OGD94530.1 MAG: DNA repair protein RecO [Candidatus Curtissbacteria bacterium RIFCSPHIGHO2_01_FULL_41_44]OGD97915.1 MAG: DNA repair protein RecO [Candidatus Curtissbacteria bacterium RIFCSPHIGHO2_12_FULL_42_33]OGD98563.1 MAG: DNA repair protein RecO [Candidatus Curtissbacteria bacterium RIFCSPLOWO2_01_FULL_42_50]OGE02140.1 MAG: DNA repair protein RecO [Candidatus Curtissbacteria bacterium RIFCSPLOWO
MYFRTEGVVLKRNNFGEADRIVTIYTRDYGKISAIAKGVRRPRSKKAGHVELGNWCKIFVARGKNIDLLTEVELKCAFGIANFSVEKANRIYHLLELVESLTPEHQKNPQVFILLVQFLKMLSKPGPPREAGGGKDEDFSLLSSVFKIKLLSTLGFFSSQSLKDSRTKDIFKTLELEDFETIKEEINLSPSSYLKLLSFLDSMIESLTQTKLKTSRFL